MGVSQRHIKHLPTVFRVPIPLFGHTSGMPAEIPVFRLESAFLNLAAFGDGSFAASAGCRSGSFSFRPTRRGHTDSSDVQHQHPGTQLLEWTMGTLAGTDGFCGGRFAGPASGGRSAALAGR